MNNLKRPGAAIALTFVLSAAAFACDPPQPGEVATMPCSAAQVTSDDAAAQGEIPAGPASVARTSFSVTELVMGLVKIAVF